MMRRLESEAKNIEKSVIDMCWHQRSMSLEEAYNLTSQQRKIIIGLIEKRVETVEKTHLPLM